MSERPLERIKIDIIHELEKLEEECRKIIPCPGRCDLCYLGQQMIILYAHIKKIREIINARRRQNKA